MFAGMQTIALFNQNGGIGKSTLSVHLACWLAERGFNLVVLDTDPQAAACRWLKKAAPGIKCLTPIEPDEIERVVVALRPHVDVIVADSKPGLDPAALKLLKLADRVLMPVVPSGMNMEGTTQAIMTMDRIGAFKGKGEDFAWAILNIVDEGTGQAKRAKTRLAMLGIRPAVTTIGRRMVFREAYDHGTVVWRLKTVNTGFTQPARLATNELEALFNEVLPDGLKQRKNDPLGNQAAGERRTLPGERDDAGSPAAA